MIKSIRLRDRDEAKIRCLDLLNQLTLLGHVSFGAPDRSHLSIDQVLDTIVEGGELRLNFPSATPALELAKVQRAMKKYQRGVLTLFELRQQMLGSLEVIQKTAEEIQPSLILVERLQLELERMWLLLRDVFDPPVDESPDEVHSSFPIQYVHRLCECVASLLEELVGSAASTEAFSLRERLAKELIEITRGDLLLVTDGLKFELNAAEILQTIESGGSLHLHILSDDDVLAIGEIRRLIDSWHCGCITNADLCLRIKLAVNGLHNVDPDWWDRMYAELRELWIVAMAKPDDRCRASSCTEARELLFRLEHVEQLTHSPLGI